MSHSRGTALVDRRRLLKGIGATLLVTGTGIGPARRVWAQEQCSVLAKPSLTEGPYFVDEILNRSDIRIDPSDNSVQDGVRLDLLINVQQKGADCSVTPLSGAYVDIWHCNAFGVYSDVAQQGTTGKQFLRGYQPTDRKGNVQFVTVYPGWYQGRTVHIHAKVRMFDGLDQQYEFTTQFFDDEVTNEVFALAPYSDRPGRDTLNTSDGIYNGASSLGDFASDSGSELMLSLAESKRKDDLVDRARRGRSRLGITASINLVVDRTLGSSPDQSPGGGGGPMGPGGGMPRQGPPPTGV